MRKNRTLLYISGALVLLVLIGTLLGYRLSVGQLNSEINQRAHFNPATIIYSEITGSRGVVVSKNNNWIVCRQYDRNFGLLWKYNELTLEPREVDPLSASYTSILSDYISQCNQMDQTKILTKDHPKINFSLKNYFNQEAIGVARGKAFEVKIVRLVKITVSTNDPKENVQYYYYDILIAPITDQLPLQFKNVIVYPTGKAVDYFKNKQTYLYPAPNQYRDFVKTVTFNKWDEIRNLYVYEYTFLYSNLSDSVQSERKMSTFDLDEGMKTIDVTISYNNTSETIRVGLDEPLVTVNTNNDPLMELDSNIKDIFENKGITSSFGIFATTKPKQ
jgi:hypothetical protein